jgi:hypothetical protein
MSPSTRSPNNHDSLSVKLGNWFEAHATGRGVIAVPIVVLIVVAAAAVKLLFFR